jgi:hypothetical protein
MLERSEISFIFLWVINPIVILFYQNCATQASSPFTNEPSAIEAPQIKTQAQKGIPVCMSKYGGACDDTKKE